MKIFKIKPIILISVFFFIMSILIPLTGDDWTWKSERGIERLKSGFSGYNGRYISNLLEIISVRFELFKIFLMTCFSTLLIFFMSKLVFREDSNNRSIYVLVLVILMPITIFQQTFGWVAGYVNYVISIVFVLYFILLFRNIFENNIKLKTWQRYVNTLLAVFSMLFVEHISLYLLFIGLAFNLLLYIKYKTYSIDSSLALLGFIVGFIIMFSNKAYLAVFTGADTYRTIGSDESLIVKMFNIYVYQMNFHFYINNILIITMIFTIALITILVKRKINAINTVLLLLLGSGPLFLFINQENLLEFRKGSGIYLLSSLIFSLFLIAFILFLIYNFKNTPIFYETLFYLTSSFILSAPFLIITPYGGRAAMGSFIFIILLLLKLMRYLLKNNNFNHHIIIKFGIIIVLSFSILYPLYENKKVELERNSLVSQINHTMETITLPKLPYPEFHQMPDPEENLHMTKFYKEIYKIDPETKFVFKP